MSPFREFNEIAANLPTALPPSHPSELYPSVFGVIHTPRMNILLTSHGSTGDIFPVIGLGRALVAAGHRATFAASPYFADEIRRAGLDWLPIPPDWDQDRFAETMLELSRIGSPLKQLKVIFGAIEPYAVEYFEKLDAAMPDFDLLVASYLLPQLRELARRHNKPFAVLTFCHNVVPAAEIPPPPLPHLQFMPSALRKVWAGMGWSMGDRVLSHASNRHLGSACRKLGIPPLRHFMTDPADRALVCVSPALFAPAGEPQPKFPFTGYLRWQSAQDPQVEPRIMEFTQGKSVPILTFGSVTFDDTQRLLGEFLHNLPRNQPIILQSGWSDLSNGIADRPVLHLQRISHDQLFRHAAVVIHHGGAGTTASALHAGCPQIIIPHIADQEFWGREISRLQCGKCLPRKNWPKHLPGLIQSVISSPELKHTAVAHARTVNAEDGPANAIAVLEELV